MKTEYPQAYLDYLKEQKPEDLTQEIVKFRALVDHPSWQAMLEKLEILRSQAEEILHSTDPTNVAAIAAAQSASYAYSKIASLPQSIINEDEESLKALQEIGEVK